MREEVFNEVFEQAACLQFEQVKTWKAASANGRRKKVVDRVTLPITTKDLEAVCFISSWQLTSAERTHSILKVAREKLEAEEEKVKVANSCDKTNETVILNPRVCIVETKTIAL